VHSESNAAVLSGHHGIARDRIAVIPHGTLDLFVKADGDYTSVRHRFGIPAQDKVILMFGAIRPYKGIDTAIQALAEISSLQPRIHLLVAGRLWGDWQPYQELVDQHALCGRVHLHLDYVPSDEVADYFHAADLVLLPYHRFDSQSGVGAVALAFAKPMLVTDVGGLPDLVGEKARILPPGNVPTLAAELRRVFSEPGSLERMREDAAAMAKRYSWTEIAERTRALYADTLGIPV
jgi:glycosyltransferase involved in cell wall biosynthesis